MNTLRSTARRALGTVMLLAGVVLTASACVFVPVDGPGYAAAPAPVYGGPPAVIVAPRVVAPRRGWYGHHHRYYW